MFRKHILSVFLFVYIFTFPQKVYAKESLSVYYLRYDNNGKDYWVEKKIKYIGDFNENERIEIVFDELFNEELDRNTYLFPEGTKLISINKIEGVLTINISEDIKDYGGGSYRENTIISQLLKTAFSIEGVYEVTILINDVSGEFPEGTVIDKVKVWKDTTGELIYSGN